MDPYPLYINHPHCPRRRPPSHCGSLHCHPHQTISTCGLSPLRHIFLVRGRYAKVYLASYRRDLKGKSKDMLGEELPGCLTANPEGSGVVGGTWRLCAAKCMASDRESQTMGLREAFFLGRLRGSGINGKVSALSPLRSNGRDRRNGSIYVIKLIAVKEEHEPTRRQAAHSRSSSDMKSGRALTRQRSSTCVDNIDNSAFSLLPSPSLPALAKSTKAAAPAPSSSRLLLLLEHARLGTLDQLLRTSPNLVGKNMWERWARQGAEALEWVHAKGVVHADIKPGNLLVSVRGKCR